MTDYDKYMQYIDGDQQVVVNLSLKPDADLGQVAEGLAPLVVTVDADQRKIGMSVTLSSAGGVSVLLSAFDADGNALPVETSTFNHALFVTV